VIDLHIPAMQSFIKARVRQMITEEETCNQLRRQKIIIIIIIIIIKLHGLNQCPLV